MASAHGVPAVAVIETTPRTIVRPDAAVVAYGSLAEKVWPPVTVKDVALPMALPFAPRKETLPAHEAAVPPAVAAARLVRLICAVSELASPMAGSAVDRVAVV